MPLGKKKVLYAFPPRNLNFSVNPNKVAINEKDMQLKEIKILNIKCILY
jgi:hypothetical protein